MNALDLKIENVSLDLNEQCIASTETIYCPERETVTFLFQKELPVAEKAVLSMNFTGELNDKMKGFYRSKYYTSSGEERFAGVTQFEATGNLSFSSIKSSHINF